MQTSVMLDIILCATCIGLVWHVVCCHLGGRRTGGYNDRPSNSGSSYGGGRNESYSSTNYGSYGSKSKLIMNKASSSVAMVDH